MIHTIDFTKEENLLRDVDALLSACGCALRSVVSSVHNHSIGEPVLKRYTMMSAAIEVNWSEESRRKEVLIEKNPNEKRMYHGGKVGHYDKLIYDNNAYMLPTKLSAPSYGLYQIKEVHKNGTINIQARG